MEHRLTRRRDGPLFSAANYSRKQIIMYDLNDTASRVYGWKQPKKHNYTLVIFLAAFALLAIVSTVLGHAFGLAALG